MPILDGLFTPTLRSLQTALTLTSKRQSMLTANIANVNVPGYKRKDIDFNLTLEQTMGGEAADRGASLHAMNDEMAQKASDETSIRVDGNNVDMEKESMSVAETQMRYDALSLMTSDYFSGLKNAIREGR